jgi:hypothetical protein
VQTCREVFDNILDSYSLKTLEAVERDYILQVLEQTPLKVSGKDSAAEILGLDPGT